MAPRCGYPPGVTLRPEDDGPTELSDVPSEEGVSEADAADRAELDPREQPNFTERSSQPVGEPPRFEHLPGEAPSSDEEGRS